MAMLLQGLAGFERAAAHMVARNAVRLERNDLGLRRLEQLARKNFAEKTPDH
jgi:hypothetical protein